MMSQYFSSVPIADFDDQLSAASARVVEGGGGSAYVVSVKNENGDIYRQFLPSDAWAYLQLCEELEEVGFVDELDGEGDDRGRFKSVFKRPPVPNKVARRTRIRHQLLQTILPALTRQAKAATLTARMRMIPTLPRHLIVTSSKSTDQGGIDPPAEA